MQIGHRKIMYKNTSQGYIVEKIDFISFLIWRYYGISVKLMKPTYPDTFFRKRPSNNQK